MLTRTFVAVLLVAVGAGAVLVYQEYAPAPGPGGAAVAPPGGGGGVGSRPGGGSPAGGRRGFGPQAMLVETVPVSRADVSEQLQIVGNLVGAASVEVAPKLNGRLRQLDLRLGDPVARGQALARIEDDELQQQVSQSEASFEVARATVRQREADLALAETTRERSQSLFDRSLISRQELDDGEALYQAATAQLDLARAQLNQAAARLEELRINLDQTVIVSPVDGFIGRRYLDPGAYVMPSTAVVSVVDLSLVRLVANLVERDLRLVGEGVQARIEVDAFPGESFDGRVARIAPVLDPATRTAEIEIEVPNPQFRLKPGMYARVRLGVGTKAAALVVPREAVVLRTGARGVFVVEPAAAPPVVRFVSMAVGLEDDRHVEVLAGVAEGDIVVTTGAAGLEHGDLVRLVDGPPPPARGGGDGRPPATPLPSAPGASPAPARSAPDPATPSWWTAVTAGSGAPAAREAAGPARPPDPPSR